MEPVIAGVLLVLLVLMFGPAARGTAAAIDSVENPGRPETQAQRDQVHSDMWRLGLGLLVAFGVLAVMQMGG